MRFLVQKFLDWLPQLDYRVWILIAGRSLSQLGTGFTLFYASIFFVNQVGLSATAVGVGIGSASISGIVGRILGGTFADSPQWGRRPTLLLSSAISTLAAVVLSIATTFPLFLLGNLLMGFGVGLYWPSTEAVVADLTQADQRNEAYALTRLGDNLGLGLGVVLGGALITLTGAYRALFVVDAISFAIFFVVVYRAIAETRDPNQPHPPMLKGWVRALSDRILLIYVTVNILFTTYLSQMESALPLYFTNFVSRHTEAAGFAPGTLTLLFSWYMGLTVVTQLPIARRLNRFSRPRVLILSALAWGIGFILIWVTGTTAMGQLLWAMAGLGTMAIATAAYTPAASSLVITLAPDSLRGVYLAVNSLCWALGYFIGPTVGGWAMDQSQAIADGFWVVSALSVVVAIGILQYLDRLLRRAYPVQ
ncbi:MFS transporter [Oscillatoria sp. FACHB-1407]|uniref:MFS transporter n=1 Tax=Oscillatoria sp. FACHB-1407 TaxID=2692847 RepID=UPI0016825A63|nr:MFS transporter [Oscillatoria sp. FACHB-1407]MBD2463877.1 MFS transporter [Oscillatoria sp. FACHB-1407]